jgi:hypothetical protein
MLDLRDVTGPLLVDGCGLNTSPPPVACASRPSSPSAVLSELYDLDEEMVCNVVGENAPGPTSPGKPPNPMSTLFRWFRGEMKDDRRERTAAMSRPAGNTWWG